jgi:predicted Rossmann-fold nucleotide-binding protein
MGIANKVAYDLKILSLAHLCNFAFEPMNPHLDGKMTYRIERMIERQAEFLVKLPIFFIGGYGTDLELSLEVVGRQVGSYELTPILLFGEVDYWVEKITSRFTLNHKSGTLRSGEYLSNCLIQVSSGEQALEVYKQFFIHKLHLGSSGRVYPRGFRIFEEIYDDV